MPRSPSREEIYDIARRANEIFASRGFYCCLFGSAACSLFGLRRRPNDVDLVVMGCPDDTELLKRILVQNDDDFYLTPSRMRPAASYKVLWYSLPTPSRAQSPRKCKVDLLLPGILEIPFIPRHRVVTREDLPVMPLFPLILMKLKGWDDHRASWRRDFRIKQHVDVKDIRRLLKIASKKKRIRLDRSYWLPRDFLDASQSRVEEFVEAFPRTTSAWRKLGFDL